MLNISKLGISRLLGNLVQPFANNVGNIELL